MSCSPEISRQTTSHHNKRLSLNDMESPPRRKSLNRSSQNTQMLFDSYQTSAMERQLRQKISLLQVENDQLSN